MDPVDFDLEEQELRGEHDYRPFSAAALVALGFGLLSLLVWVSGQLWFVAPLGVLIAVLALRHIAASDPPLLGRGLARLALALSLVNSVAIATNSYVYARLVDQEAKEFAQYWFELQLSGFSEDAARMVKIAAVDPKAMQPPGDDIVKVSVKDHLLASYVEGREVRTLLALADRAQVRYYDTEVQERMENHDLVKQIYAVTYDQEGTKTTFFMALTMERKVASDVKYAVWKITDLAGGVHPKCREALDQAKQGI